jgi:hypothetical protein
VLQLVGGAEYLTAFEAGQLDAHVTVFLEGFNSAWLIGLVCFGSHLALLGSLVLTSGYIPKVLGVLILAGAGYVIDTLANALLANYGDYETTFLLVVAVPSLIGEFAFTIWLLMRGGKEYPADSHGDLEEAVGLDARP